jgi:hypothetical protein
MNPIFTEWEHFMLIKYVGLIFAIKECYFSDCTNKKTKKVIFGIKECYFSDCTNKQTKKNPKKTKTTTKNHTIVGREKWLLYFQV